MPRPQLKKRPDGRYVCYRDGKAFYGNTSLEAYKKRDQYDLEKSQGLSHKTPTVEEYAKQWLPAHKSQCTQRSYNAYSAIVDKINGSIGKKLIRDVTQTDIQQLLNTQAGMSKSSVHIFSITLRSIFRCALADRLIYSDPCIGAKDPSSESGTHRAITLEERNLVMSVEHKMRPAAMAMLYCGLRRGEALGLNASDIDIENRTLTVGRSIRWDSNQPIIAPPKTNAGNRTVPIPEILVPHLPKTGMLISTDGKPLTQCSFTRQWESWLRALSAAAGHPVEIRPHDLRHSCITMWYSAGIDALTCSQWAGHADIATTMRIYTHLTAEHEKEQKNTLINALTFAKDGQNDGQRQIYGQKKEPLCGLK